MACATARRVASRSARAFSSSDRVSRMRFCVAKPANSGRLNGRPTLAVLVRVLRGRRLGAAVRVARDVVAGRQVQRGLVAGLGLLGFELRDLQRRAWPAGWSGCSPRPCCTQVLTSAGCGAGTIDRRRQRLGLARRACRPAVERELLDAQVVLGRDFLRDHQVVAGLRLARVGDGGGADLEVALGRGQLLGHRGLLRLHEGQRVLRRQHVEVSLADADDQVLARPPSSWAWASSTWRLPCS